jgi:hypothetical protein
MKNPKLLETMEYEARKIMWSRSTFLLTCWRPHQSLFFTVIWKKGKQKRGNDQWAILCLGKGPAGPAPPPTCSRLLLHLLLLAVERAVAGLASSDVLATPHRGQVRGDKAAAPCAPWLILSLSVAPLPIPRRFSPLPSAIVAVSR